MKEIKYEDMLNTITLGDSYKLIKYIPDNSVDLVYIDIPYLIEDGGCSSSPLSKKIARVQKNEIEKIRHGIDYTILDELCRVMKQIYCYIWCSKEQILHITKYFVEEKKCRVNYLVWCKTNPTPMTNNVWLPDIEYCLCFKGENTPRYNDGYELKSKWYISEKNKKDKERYNHPTIKPLKLVKRHILHSTQPKDIVLDCFSGSGTTCVACKELDRQFIGIEIGPEYHKISIDRLNGILANGQISFETDISKL